jgi:hypothetical protein
VNVQARVDQFVSRVMDLKAFYDGNNIMLQMGRYRSSHHLA